MKRSDFLATLFGAPVVVKALELPKRTDGKPTLLAFETPQHLSYEAVQRIRERLGPYAKRHNFEIMVLSGGMTVKPVA